MPELPEVEVTRRGLSALMLGERIESLEIVGGRTIRRNRDALDPRKVAGRTVLGLSRWGKFLAIDIAAPGTGSGESEVLVWHLGMSGRFVIDNEIDTLVGAHIKASLLVGGHRIVFYDPRTFGEVFVSRHSDDQGRPIELSHLGIDAMSGSKELYPVLTNAFRRSKTTIKARLLDQRIICGIGNIYSDEILFRSQIHPRTTSAMLSPTQAQTISFVIGEVLGQAIELGGSSLRDKSYKGPLGDLGSYQNHHLAYGRAAEACVVCGTMIVREVIVGRSAHYCPVCQQLPDHLNPVL